MLEEQECADSGLAVNDYLPINSGLSSIPQSSGKLLSDSISGRMKVSITGTSTDLSLEFVSVEHKGLSTERGMKLYESM